MREAVERDPLGEALPSLTEQQALVEANRCLNCYDAPCTHACPTHIDVPAFIKKIASGNLLGSAKTILEENLLGATCARVCPVQELCEGACVLGAELRPIAIGRLQRYAMDQAGPIIVPKKGKPTGRSVAVIGAGPAGLSCAGYLALKGHAVTIYEKRELPGGLSTYGIIALREPIDVALTEVDMIRQLGVKVETGVELGRKVQYNALAKKHDAVFLAVGLGATPDLDIPGQEWILDGLQYIELSKVAREGFHVGSRVLVIGAGNTAIDCATVAKRLGAESVTMVYRRSEREMSAYAHEYEFIKNEGVAIQFLTQPIEVRLSDGRVTGLHCRRVALGAPDSSGRARPEPVPASDFVIEADQIIKAIGQEKPWVAEDLNLETDQGYIRVDENFETSLRGLFAGGDCIRAKGAASTVMAVQDGKEGGGSDPSQAVGRGSRSPPAPLIFSAQTIAENKGGAIADLSIEFAGIKSPNPFWLASAPPTNSGRQVHRAFEAGWGGAVWKTIGPPVLNVSNRYGAWDHGGQKMLGINNVELISDRPLKTNLKEIAEVKRAWPDRAVVVSAMVDSNPEAWAQIVRQIEDTGADGIELNYGCPHGMSERGMGSAVGQVPEYCEQITHWVKQVATIPVIVKLTPNITNIAAPARAAVAAKADAISLINTLNSITGVDLDSFEIVPSIDGKGGHGGYAGPAVKPIALHMLSAVSNDPIVRQAGIPVSAMGGISNWRDAAEFLLLGAGSLQLCTAVMHYGFRIIEDLCDGLSNWMDSKGLTSIDQFRGASLGRLANFGEFNLSYRAVARIDPAKCIRCNLCYVACEDTAHQCIDLIGTNGLKQQPNAYDIRSNGKQEAIDGRAQPTVRVDDCVGCRLCHNVCPVEGCIEMVSLPPDKPATTWEQISQREPAVTSDWEAMDEYRRRAGINIH